MAEIKDFNPMTIKNASVQFIVGGEQQEGKKFGCMGTLSAETEVREIVKKCEGDERIITLPRYMTVTVGGHVKRDVIRDIYGINTTGLKEGVYSYGLSSKGKRFVFTAEATDEFEDVTQLVAFPRCANMTGLSITIDNDVDEVAYLDLEFRANADELGNFYYEAFKGDVDEDIVEEWHTEFTLDLVSDGTIEIDDDNEEE